MPYLDEIQRQNTEYIDALGAARTAREKAAVIASLLPARRREAAKKGALERAQLSTQAVKARQAAQESASPIPAQDEEILSMAPPELPITGAPGLGIGANSGASQGGGVDILKEIFSGGGKQVKTAGTTTTPAAQPGYQNVTTTQTTQAGEPQGVLGKIMALHPSVARARLPQTTTTTQTQRDPAIFQTNVTAAASSLTAGDQEQFNKQINEISQTYGTPYALEVKDMARRTAETAHNARILQRGELSRQIAAEFSLDMPTAGAVADAEINMDWAKRDKLLAGHKSMELRVEEAKLRAANASTEREEIASKEILQRMRLNLMDRQMAWKALNATPLSVRYLGNSLSAGTRTPQVGSAAQGGARGKSSPYVGLDDLVDKEGNLKPESKAELKVRQHQALDEGGLLTYTPGEGGWKKWSLVFSGAESGFSVVTLDDAAQMIFRKDTESLEKLGLIHKKSIGGETRWMFAYKDDPLDPSADPSRALEKRVDELNRQDAVLASMIQTDRGVKESVQRATPSPVPPRVLATNVETPPKEARLTTDIGEALRSRDREERAKIKAFLQSLAELPGRKEREFERKTRRIFRPWPGSMPSE